MGRGPSSRARRRATPRSAQLANDARRVARDEHARWDREVDDGARRDDRALADVRAAEQDGLRSHPRVVTQTHRRAAAAALAGHGERAVRDDDLEAGHHAVADLDEPVGADDELAQRALVADDEAALGAELEAAPRVHAGVAPDAHGTR